MESFSLLSLVVMLVTVVKETDEEAEGENTKPDLYFGRESLPRDPIITGTRDPIITAVK